MAIVATGIIPGSTMTYTLESVKLVRDADACYCPTCGMYADDATPTAWSWRSTRWMHERGTGHKVALVRMVWHRKTHDE